MRNILVTGGSRGIGLGMATTLANSGYRVIALARGRTDQLDEASPAAREAKRGSIEFKQFDLNDVDRIGDMVRELRSEFGSIFGLVNNAGLGTPGLLATMHNSDIARLIQVNTIAPIVLSKYVVRHMMSDGAGRIVNISSIVAFTGYKAISVYSATKSGLIGFTRSLAREVGPLGICVNAVAPGFLETEMTGEMNPREQQRVIARSALRRLATVEDVARTVDFLMSDAARNITGTTITVDAGSTA